MDAASRTRPQRTDPASAAPTAVCSLPLRRSGISGGLSTCSPHPAAVSQPFVTAARRGSPPFTAVTPAHRTSAAGARLQRRHGPQQARPWTPKESVAQGSGLALRVGTAGDLIHIDITSLARFCRVRHRNTGDRQQGRSYGVGHDKVHVVLMSLHGLRTSRCWRMSRSQWWSAFSAGLSPGSKFRVSSAVG